MIKDRLEELQKICKRNGSGIPTTVSEDVSIELDDGYDGALLLLLDKIGPLYTRVKALEVDVVELCKGLNDHSKREKLGERISGVKTEAISLYKSIKEVSSFIDSESHLISHVARTHHFALVIYFSSANTELANLQVELRDKHKSYVQKELRITGQEVTDEELENLLDRSAEIFNQNLLMETQVAKQRLLDVQHWHEDIIKIEKSIVEVNQLFQDLAFLVKEQGEQINRIENFVFEAQERATMAKVELGEARTKQTKARKKKYILMCILSVVVLIILLSIIFSFT